MKCFESNKVGLWDRWISVKLSHPINKEDFNHFDCLFLFAEVDMDPNRTFCPEAGCETVCHVCSAASAAAAQPTPVQCPTVGFHPPTCPVTRSVSSDLSLYTAHTLPAPDFSLLTLFQPLTLHCSFPAPDFTLLTLFQPLTLHWWLSSGLWLYIADSLLAFGFTLMTLFWPPAWKVETGLPSWSYPKSTFCQALIVKRWPLDVEHIYKTCVLFLVT